MSRLAGIILRLYPAAWRERYREEYEALLEDHGVGAGTLADMLGGVLDAHVREIAAAPPERRQRSALAACLWGVAAAAVAVAGFAKMVEYDDFASAAARHAPVAAGRDLIFAGAAIVALAVCVGGLVVAAALWRDLGRDEGSDLVRPLAAAVAATALIAAGPPVLAVYAHTASPRPPHDPRTLAVVAAWLGASALGGIVALAGAGRILRRVPLRPRELHRSMTAAWIAAGGMCVIALGLGLWGIALATEAGRVFHLSDGGILATPTFATWGLEAVLGAGAAAFALVVLTRAGGASPRPRSAPSSPASPPPAGRSSSSG